MSSSLVDITGLEFGYARQPVLSGIDLRVEPGTTLGLIGPNGGGKTTLIRLLLGVLQPTAGSIRIAMDPLASASAHGSARSAASVAHSQNRPSSRHIRTDGSLAAARSAGTSSRTPSAIRCTARHSTNGARRNKCPESR